MEQVMKKRISALLMALMLAVGMLSGCDNTSINSSDSGKTKVILATDTQTHDDSLNNKTQVVDNDDSANITTKAQKSNKSANSSKNESNKSKATKSSKSTKIPEYNGKAYVELNGNNPEFKSKEITDKSFEKYGSLDSLGVVQMIAVRNQLRALHIAGEDFLIGIQIIRTCLIALVCTIS